MKKKIFLLSAIFLFIVCKEYSKTSEGYGRDCGIKTITGIVHAVSKDKLYIEQKRESRSKISYKVKNGSEDDIKYIINNNNKTITVRGRVVEHSKYNLDIYIEEIINR